MPRLSGQIALLPPSFLLQDWIIVATWNPNRLAVPWSTVGLRSLTPYIPIRNAGDSLCSYERLLLATDQIPRSISFPSARQHTSDDSSFLGAAHALARAAYSALIRTHLFVSKAFSFRALRGNHLESAYLSQTRRHIIATGFLRPHFCSHPVFFKSYERSVSLEGDDPARRGSSEGNAVSLEK
jgi:hypothetical protein